MLLSCGAGEDSWESLGLQGDLTSPSWRKSILGVHWKDWCWSWNSWCKELTHWKRPWCWGRLKVGGDGDNRGWDGWMASSVIATRSGKQTHSEGQCRQWSAVYYTSMPKAESPLSQGPRPAFVKIFYTPCVCVQTHHSKFLETHINKGRVNTTTITPSFTCYVFKQLIINKPMVTFQPVNNQ